jgi:hypothetical protein
MGRLRIGLVLPASVCLLALGCGASRRSGSAPTSTGFRSEPVQFLPGGMQTLGRASLPGTAGYSVRAERYRFQHRTYFNLAVNVQEIGGGSQGTNFTPEPAKSKPLAWSTEQGCSPSESIWTVLFGMLADPQDRAYAYTAHGRHRLRTATISARFRAKGVAAYTGLAEQPIRMLVTTARGVTLMSEKLETVPKEHCRPGTGIMVMRKKKT